VRIKYATTVWTTENKDFIMMVFFTISFSNFKTIELEYSKIEKINCQLQNPLSNPTHKSFIKIRFVFQDVRKSSRPQNLSVITKNHPIIQ
jgi:hypothetical protein